MTRVLVVEDSEDVLDLLRLQLEGIGYVIDTATNGRAALEIAQHTRPDIIVSDLRMPDTDGLEFIRRVRGIRSLASVPAIVLTGTAFESDIRQAIFNGFTAHLRKPVEPSELYRLIEQLTARCSQRQAS